MNRPNMLAILAQLILFAWASSMQSSNGQKFYPGIVVDFNCNVDNPFIQVNDIERTQERGIDGYVEDVRAMGIETKGLIPNNSFIPVVCAIGSSTELRNVSTITITLKCQDIQLDNNFQLTYIHHFTFTLTYRNRLPAPDYVRMSDNNVLEWSRPPCVTNSSSDTYSIEVNHTLEYTYTIYINITTDGTTTNITAVSTTSYDLSDMLQPCFEYNIAVCACNSETVCEDNERSSPINFTMPGCPVNPNPPASEDTVTTTSTPVVDQEVDMTKQTNFTIGLILGVAIAVTIIIIITVILPIALFILITKRNRKANAVTNDINPEDFISKGNTYVDSNPSHKPTPPTYEQSQHSIADEEQAGNGVYSEVHTTPPSTAGRNTQTTGSSTTTNTGINGSGTERHGQQSPQRDLTYADLDLTRPNARFSPPKADTQTSSVYVMVKNQPQTD